MKAATKYADLMYIAWVEAVPLAKFRLHLSSETASERRQRVKLTRARTVPVRNPRAQPDRIRPQRWLIDTNLWSCVADASLGSDLIKAARRKQIEILAAPSVLYELLRTPNESVRKRFMDVITLPHWKRLMPETFSETKEILAEIRRLRPDWLRTTPNRSQYMRIFHDWRSRNRGMWQRARDTPSREAEFIDQLGGADLQTARDEAHESARRLTRWA